MISKYDENMHVAAEYNLVYNGSVMAAEGMGYCVTFDKLINVSGDSKLCFKPLLPKFEATCTFVWKKYTVFTKAAELFLRQFREDIEELKNNTEKG